jgi:uncharacterized protein YjdB
MNAPGSIELYTDGGVEIHADQPTDCQLYVVADEGDRTLSLPKVQVEASSIQNVSLSLDDEGIIVSGDDLSDLSISGSSRSRMVELAVSSETNEILLSETDGEFAAYVDSDQDGIYDEKVSEVIQEKSLCVHSYETVTDKGAACTETGHQYERCTYCGEKKSDSDVTLPAEGHKFSKWTIASSATVFQPTTEKRSCSACGAIETRTTGTKLTPTIAVNAESFPLKVKQSTTALQVTGLAEGDYIASWQSSNVRIVTVSEDGKIKAGKKTGKAVITITLASGLQKNVTVTVQKSSVKTKKISAVQKKLTMNKGDSIALQPVITPITSTQKVTYKSSDKKVVTVSANGMLKAKKKGKATITVKSGSKTVKCKVTVR